MCCFNIPTTYIWSIKNNAIEYKIKQHNFDMYPNRYTKKPEAECV